MAILGLSASADSAFAQDPPTTWTFGLGVREANQFSRVVNGVSQEDRIVDNANASLRLATRTERAQLGLFGRVGGNVPREGSGRDRVNYGGGFSWSFRPSERLTSDLSQSFNRGIRLQTLSELGVLEPDIDTFNTRSAWGLRYRTSPRTTIATRLGYSYTKLETEEQISGSQIVLDDFVSDDPFSPLDGGGSQDEEILVPDAEDQILDVLASEGLSFRETTNQAAFAAFGLSTQPSSRTTWGFDVSGGYRSIDTSGTSGFREGAESGARLWLQRSVGSASSLLASYTFRRSLAIEPSTTIQTALGGVSYSPRGRSVALNLQGGTSYFQAEGGLETLTPVVLATFSASLTESTRFGAAYRRQFRQSLGFGRTLLIEYANVNLSQDIGSRVTVRALAAASFGTDPLAENSRFDAFRAGGSLNVRILEPLSAGTSFFALDTEQQRGLLPRDTSRNLWSIYLNFSQSWN